VGFAEKVNIRTPQYWRVRAEEARIRAGDMHDPEAISTMLGIALRYELMAQRIAEREGARHQS
jgi:hypothetical protein